MNTNGFYHLPNTIMKKSIKFLGCCLLGMVTCISVSAQKIYTDDSIALKKRIYKVSIISSDSKKSFGYLASLSDSNLYLSPSPLRFSLVKINDHISSYSYDHLENIEIKRKGAAGRGLWQGALIGMVGGIIIGFASGDDPDDPNDPSGIFEFRLSAGEKAVAGGFIGAVTGSLVGALVGSLIKKKFILGRNKEKFQAMRQNILKKLYMR